MHIITHDGGFSGSSDTDNWTYTFENSGTYTVKAIVYDEHWETDPTNGAAIWTVNVVQPVGDLVVTVQNANGATPKEEATVMLYKAENNVYFKGEKTDGGKATFSDIPTGAYHIEAYYNDEFWGVLRDVSVGTDTTNKTIRRYMPYAERICTKDTSNQSKTDFQLSETVRIVATVRNKDTRSQQAKVTCQADRDKAGSADFSQTSNYQTIAGGATKDYIFEFKPTAPGQYFIRPQVTYTLVDGKDYKTDSWDWAPALFFYIAQSKSDLTVTKVSIDQDDVLREQNITIQVTGKNIGQAKSGLFFIQTYLTKNHDTSPNDGDNIQLGGDVYGPLNPNQEITYPISVQIPSNTDLASYYACAWIDYQNTNVESNEDNNIGLSDDTVTITLPKPDLTVTQVSIDEDSAQHGQNITVRVTGKNIGQGNSGEFYIYTYLTEDKDYSPNDIDNITLQGGTFGPLNANQEDTYTLTAAVPVDAKFTSYYVLAWIDYFDDNDESNEDNNIGLSDDTVTIIRPSERTPTCFTFVDWDPILGFKTKETDYETQPGVPVLLQVKLEENSIPYTDIEEQDIYFQINLSGSWHTIPDDGVTFTSFTTDKSSDFGLGSGGIGRVYYLPPEDMATRDYPIRAVYDGSTLYSPTSLEKKLYILPYHSEGILIHPETPHRNRIPLILVHGISQETENLGRWGDFKKYIDEHSDKFKYFDVYVWMHDTSGAVGFNGYTGCAAKLKEYIDGLLPKYNDGTKVLFVAHSHGGLVVRSYMNYDHQGDNVLGLITLGTPHHGTPFVVADWAAVAWKNFPKLPLPKPVFNLLVSVGGRGYDIGSLGYLNLTWDNLDNAIVGEIPIDFNALFAHDGRIYLTSGDTNDENTHSDLTILYSDDYKDDFGTLAELNRNESYHDKIVAFAAYSDNLPDIDLLDILQDIIDREVPPMDEHLGLTALTNLLAYYSINIVSNNSVYFANDGMVPLQSALFLDISGDIPFSGILSEEVILFERYIDESKQVKRHYIFNGQNDNIRDHLHLVDAPLNNPYWTKLASEIRAFITPLQTPSLISPRDEEIISTLTPTFKWSTLEDSGVGAEQPGYQLRVRSYDDGDALVYDTGFIAGHTHTYTPGAYTGRDPVTGDTRISNTLEWGKHYHWHVRYRDSGGDWSAWSANGHFSIRSTEYLKFTSRGIYVWGFAPNIARDDPDGTRERFLNFCKAHDIKTAFMWADPSNLDSYADLIRLAHGNPYNMEIHALFGAYDNQSTDWSTHHDTAYQKIDRILAYNKAHQASERFDGIHIDQEFVDVNNIDHPGDDNDYVGLLTGFKLHTNDGESMASQDMALSIATEPWWDNSGDVIQKLTDIYDVDYIVIMAYQDDASAIENLAQKHVDAAKNAGKDAAIALETQELSAGDRTFFEEGEWKLEDTITQVGTYFGNSIAGFAIHYYESYALWESIDQTSISIDSGPHKRGDTVSAQVTIRKSDKLSRKMRVGFSVKDKNGKIYPDESDPTQDNSIIVNFGETEFEKPLTLEWEIPQDATLGTYEATISAWDIDFLNGSDRTPIIELDRWGWVSNVFTINPDDIPPPSPPSNLDAVAISSSQIDLTWNDNSDNEDGFEIERSLDGQSYSLVTKVNANTHSYSDTGLDSETTYFYRVRAYKGSTYSEYSNDAPATTAPDNPPHIAVTPPNQNVPAGSGDTTFSVSNTGGGILDWTASVVEGNSWLNITSVGSGTNSGTIQAHYGENNEAISRVGKIQITAPGANNTPQEVTVTQAGGTLPHIAVTPPNQNVPASSGDTTFSVSNTGGGTLNWTASVVEGSSWLSIPPGDHTGTDSGTIQVHYEENSGAARVGKIQITAPGADNTPQDVTVTQAEAVIGVIKVPADQPTIQDGINAAGDGGTVRVAAGTYTESNIALNKAITVESESGAATTIIDCGGSGRGFYITADAVLNGFTITNGNITDVGGGIYSENSSPTIENCIITGNSSQVGGGGYCENSSPTFRNCVIADNYSKYDGGEIYSHNSSNPVFINCTIVGGNSKNTIYCIPGSASAIFKNSILWADSGELIALKDGASVDITFSDVKGGSPGTGNIDAEPLFVDAPNGDYHLSPNSPCIDAGTATNAPTTDIEGNNRILSPDIGA